MSERSDGKRRRRPPSLGDVARLAGVSPQTASRVSTGSDLVASETQERVRRAMEELGYTPNRAARALRQGVYKAIGVVTQQLDRTGESLTTAGIVEEAERRGYTVTVIQVSQPDTDDLKRALARTANLPIDGLIIVRIGHASSEIVTLPSNLPVTVCDSRLVGHYPSVNADQVQGVRDVVDHLASLGHRHIHHVAGAPDSHPTVVRSEAFSQALRDKGLPPGKIWPGDWTIDSGYQAGQAIALDPDVTAVFCANDEMAFGLIRALVEKGIRVPEDISVAGFDGTTLSKYSSPPLTTVSQDFTEIAQNAVRILLDQIDGSEEMTLDPVLTPVRLVVRESTGPANSRSHPQKQ